MTTQKRPITALAVLVLAGALVAVWLLRDVGGSAPDVTSAESTEATSASPEVRAALRHAAAAAATRAYSYSWKTLAADKDDARAQMTDTMQRRYDRTMAGVATSSRRDRTVVSAEVLDTALVTSTSSYARVLVFVNQSTTGDDLAEPRLDLDRVLVTLERVGGEWKVSELDAL